MIPAAESNQGFIDAYLADLDSQRKLSALTVKSYRGDLNELLTLATVGDERVLLAFVSHAQIRKFAAQLHARGLNPRSIARKLSAWRGFYSWLGECNAVTSNPVAGTKAPKRSKPLPKALSADDAVRLVAQIPPGKDAASTLQQCNQAMFELLYSSGLRVSELVALDTGYIKCEKYVSAGWLDFDAHEVMVTGKGNKMRSVPVGQAAIDALKSWLAARGALVKIDPYALFLNERGTRMSARSVQLRLKAHGQAAGLPTGVHPHVLRHSFASHLLQSSGDLRAVQEMLGHASISATQVYTSLDFQHLAQVYDVAHPRARKKTGI